MSKSITRRGFIASTAGLALALPMLNTRKAAADIADLKGSGEVIVSTWGGAYTEAQRKAFFDPFTRDTGITVITTEYPDLAKLRLMEQNGTQEWDILDLFGYELKVASREGLLQPIDYSTIGKIVPKSGLRPSAVDEFGIGAIAWGYVMTWSKEKFPNGGPKTWKEFFNNGAFDGRRTLYSNPLPALEIATLADGVPIDKVYPIDIDRAFAKLEELKPLINIWAKSNSQFDLFMQNSEIDLGGVTHGRAYNAKETGLPFDYTFEQGIWEQSFYGVPKSAPNGENAMKLLAYMMLPERCLELVKIYPYGMANTAVSDLLSPQLASSLMSAPENQAKELAINSDWWSENIDKVMPRWLNYIAEN